MFSFFDESLNPINIYKWIKFKVQFRRENPDYFDPCGILLFVGGQGTGKTLSAVNYIHKVLKTYPKCKLVTNLWLNDFPIVTQEEWEEKNLTETQKFTLSTKEKYELYVKENRIFYFKDNDSLQISNGQNGVIYLIDEIQLYFNSLHSKNINMDVMTEISQQRKQRKHIVCTTQVYGRIAKQFREQFSLLVLCKNYLGFTQYNKLIDRDCIDSDNSSDTNINGKIKHKFLWFHNPLYYQRYDTYYKVNKSSFVSGENMLPINETLIINNKGE